MAEFNKEWTVRCKANVRKAMDIIKGYRLWQIYDTNTALALIAIMALGAWFRFYAIDSKSLWVDEGVAAELTRLDRYNFLSILWHREANMSLYFMLLRAWTLMGDSVTMLRSLSVLFSLATIPAIYALGRRLYSARVGLAAALLLALNAYSVRYAQETRSYSLVTLLVTLSTLFFVCAVENGRKHNWLMYVVTSALAIYAHFFALLVVVAHGMALLSSSGLFGKAKVQSLSRNSAVKRYCRSIVYILLCTLPIGVFIFTVKVDPIHWLGPPTIGSLFDLFLFMSGNAYGAFLQHASNVLHTGLLWLFLCPLYLTLTALGTARSSRSQAETSDERWCRLLPLYWFLVPVAIALASSLIHPVFLVRYLNICLPAFVLMAAAGAMSFRQPWLRLIVLGITCYLAVGGVRAYYVKDFDVAREDFRGASEYILANAQVGDGILFYQGFGRFPFSYYADHMQAMTRPSIVFPGTDARTWHNFMTTDPPMFIDDLTQSHRRVWLVLVENMDGKEEDKTTAEMRDSLCSTRHLVAVHQFDNVRVYLYELSLLSKTNR